MTRPPLSYIPLLPILAGVVAGVLVGRFLDAGVWLTVGVTLSLTAVASLLKMRVAVEILLAATLGIVATVMALPRQFMSPPDKDKVMSGSVIDASLRPENQLVKVHVDNYGSGFDVILNYATFTPRVVAGDYVRFRGSYSLPLRQTDLPMEADLKGYYYNEGVSLLCYVPKGNLEVTGRSNNVFSLALRWRSRLVDEIAASGLDEPTATFLCAVLAGDATLVPDGERDVYASAGVAHLLALSGAHVAMIAMVIAILLLPLSWAGHRRARWWITIACLWAYAIFTGMSPSVCRAVIMATAVLVALIVDRPRSALNSLCLAAILILLFSPLSLMKPGFQLSFAATLAIIVFTPKLSPVDLHRLKGGKLLEVVAATLAATIGTLPLVAYYFHAVPVYFLLANVAAVAVMPVVMGCGVLVVALLLAGIEPTWLEELMDTFYGLFNGFIEWIATLPGAVIGNIYFDGWLMALMYLAIAFLAAFLYLRHKSYAALACATLLFVAVVILTLRPRYADGDGYVVRSHQSTTIALHRGDTLLMLTTRPRYDYTYDSVTWSRRYVDYIATRGIKHIDIQPLDSASLDPTRVIRFGHRRVAVATVLPSADTTVDYCLVTSKWYGRPVELYSTVNADTIVLSSDINRRRRNRYKKELEEAGIPVIDLSDRPLSSLWQLLSAFGIKPHGIERMGIDLAAFAVKPPSPLVEVPDHVTAMHPEHPQATVTRRTVGVDYSCPGIIQRDIPFMHATGNINILRVHEITLVK